MIEKKAVTILLSKEILDELKRRAKRDGFSLTELITYILWKSTRTSKRKRLGKGIPVEKFIDLFSRQRRGRKPKKKRKK